MYRPGKFMECFDERKCFAKAAYKDGFYCLHLVGKPYKPGECPYCKESRDERRKDYARSSEENAGEAERG